MTTLSWTPSHSALNRKKSSHIASHLPIIPPQPQDPLFFTLLLEQQDDFSFNWSFHLKHRLSCKWIIFLSLFCLICMSSEGWGWTLWRWRLLTLKSWWDVLKWQHEPVFSFDDSSAAALQQLHLCTFPNVGRGENQLWVCAGVVGE